MPVVLRVGGFAIGFFSDEHDPPHLHVRYAGKKCRIVLSTLVLSNSTMNRSEEAAAMRIVVANREALEAAWAAFHKKKGGEG
ncbi:MAG: DUF4160 domain-containing protein [Longimicrobiaceae bacterium]